MKKINKWYDSLPKRKREIFFVVMVLGTLFLAELALWVYSCFWALPLWVFVMVSFRLNYLKYKSKTHMYVFDIETGGLHDNPLYVVGKSKVSTIDLLKNKAKEDGYEIIELTREEEIRKFFKK